MTHVDSSNIEAVQLRTVVEVRFKNGSTYRYLDVPASVYEAFMSAESKGSYFAKHIKGMYPFEKLAEKTK